uniref:Uncharacterized protein n=1 Tax=Romanomermis culicivorax TaxID=13658 RepID=A0A915JBN4_ROMCU
MRKIDNDKFMTKGGVLKEKLYTYTTDIKMNFYNNFYIRTFLCISTVLLIPALYMIHSKAMKNEDFISSRSKRESNDSSSHANDIKKLSVDVINDIYRKINATEEALAAFKANKKTMIHSYKIVCKEVDSKNDNRTYSGNMEYWKWPPMGNTMKKPEIL